MDSLEAFLNMDDNDECFEPNAPAVQVPEADDDDDDLEAAARGYAVDSAKGSASTGPPRSIRLLTKAPALAAPPPRAGGGGGPPSAEGFVEKYSGLRLKRRHDGMDILTRDFAFEPLAGLQEKADSLRRNDNWCTVGVVVHKSATQRTTKGNRFMKFRLSDLNGGSALLMAFDSAFDTLWTTEVGTVLAVTKPSLLPSKEGYSLPALSVSQAVYVRSLGNSMDLSFCKGTKMQSGETCGQPVDGRKAMGYCQYHLSQAKAALEKQTKKKERLGPSIASQLWVAGQKAAKAPPAPPPTGPITTTPSRVAPSPSPTPSLKEYAKSLETKQQVPGGGLFSTVQNGRQPPAVLSQASGGYDPPARLTGGFAPLPQQQQQQQQQQRPQQLSQHPQQPASPPPGPQRFPSSAPMAAKRARDTSHPALPSSLPPPFPSNPSPDELRRFELEYTKWRAIAAAELQRTKKARKEAGAAAPSQPSTPVKSGVSTPRATPTRQVTPAKRPPPSPSTPGGTSPATPQSQVTRATTQPPRMKKAKGDVPDTLAKKRPPPDDTKSDSPSSSSTSSSSSSSSSSSPPTAPPPPSKAPRRPFTNAAYSQPSASQSSTAQRTAPGAAPSSSSSSTSSAFQEMFGKGMSSADMQQEMGELARQGHDAARRDRMDRLDTLLADLEKKGSIMEEMQKVMEMKVVGWDCKECKRLFDYKPKGCTGASHTLTKIGEVTKRVWACGNCSRRESVLGHAPMKPANSCTNCGKYMWDRTSIHKPQRTVSMLPAMQETGEEMNSYVWKY